jgi:hypothetical protein
MDCDKRFAIFDRHGQPYYAARIGGKFQVGKEREIVTDSLAEFASAVIKRSLGGRFLTPSGDKSIMGVGGRARTAVRYEFDLTIAGAIGVPARS